MCARARVACEVRCGVLHLRRNRSVGQEIDERGQRVVLAVELIRCHVSWGGGSHCQLGSASLRVQCAV